MSETFLSAVIITFNEEKNIERCLKSLQGVADEVIVVDSFSTDKTKNICLKYGVKFFEQKFLGYSAQKNYADSLATHQFLLSLDADEALSDQLKKSILAEKQKGFPAKVYEFNRLVFYSGKKIKHSGWYPDKKIRLWKKELGKWDNNLLHEKLEFAEPIHPCFLKGDLLHYTVDSIYQHISQINKFSDVKAEKAIQQGKKTNFFKIVFKPFFKFWIIYILKMGILDGFYGFVIAMNSAHSEFLRQVKIKEKGRKNGQ